MRRTQHFYNSFMELSFNLDLMYYLDSSRKSTGLQNEK